MQPTSSRSRRRRGLLVVLAASAALVLGALGAAAPATAAGTTVTMTGVQATGTVGLNQYLYITVTNPNAPCGSVAALPVSVWGNANNNQILLGQASFQSCTGTSFQYLYPWAPNQATVWYVWATAWDGTQSPAQRSAINTGPTNTAVSAPNTVKLGVSTTVTATVSPANGAVFSPQGSVTFSIVGGPTIGSATLNTATPSTASVQWVPTTLGAVSLVATYTPINAGTPSQNSNCGSSCTSPPDLVQVTSSGVNVYFANPPQLSAGVPAAITAVVSVVPPTGNVTFSANGAVFAGSVPVPSSGIVTTSWTPPAPGNYTLTALWTASNGQTSQAQETVGVGAAPSQADQIIVTVSNGQVLVPGSTYSLGNGTVVDFTTATASGAPATLTEAGPCSLTSNTFSVTQGNGQCRVTASSPGGGAYGPTSAAVTVNLVPGTQTAKLAAPASGNVNVGKTITLQKASQGKTNQGQTISWKITSGKGSICSLSFPSNGSVKLKLVKKGTCKVQANAKAVSGQWNKFQKNYSYKGV